jgi:hypothetical protein
VVPQAVNPAVHPVGSGAVDDVDDVDEVDDVDSVDDVDDADDDELLDDPEVETEVTVTVVVCRHQVS